MQLLTEYKAEEFLEKNGFNVVERKLFVNEQEAFDYAKKIGFPVVLKISSDELMHKSEIHGVKLNIYRENFIKEYRSLEKNKITKQGITVQKFINGKYIIIGLKKDPAFGHVIIAGLGGIFAEVIKDVSYRIAPIDKRQAIKMLEELKGYEILKGYRGEKINLKNVVKTIMRVNKLTKKYKNIEELDINPLVANANEAKIVDARIVFS